jgi:hypothetical protein
MSEVVKSRIRNEIIYLGRFVVSIIYMLTWAALFLVAAKVALDGHWVVALVGAIFILYAEQRMKDKF